METIEQVSFSENLETYDFASNGSSAIGGQHPQIVPPEHDQPQTMNPADVDFGFLGDLATSLSATRGGEGSASVSSIG